MFGDPQAFDASWRVPWPRNVVLKKCFGPSIMIGMITLSERERGFITGIEGRSLAGEEDRQRFLANLAADQRRAARDLPRPSDAVPSRMCTRCGMSGQHQTATGCIDALRSRLADLTGK
jgi:hypothetical protein